MKVLRMHNNADEQFDQFVKKQLEQTGADPALAQHYFEQMQLPQPSAGGSVTAAVKSSWWRFWASMAVVGIVSVALYKASKPALPSTAAPVVALPPAPGKQQADKSDSAAGYIDAPALPLPAPGASRQVTALPVIPPAPLLPRVPSDSPAQRLPLVIVPQTQATVKRKDSVPGPLRPATVIPEKTKDSVYIIWY